MNKRSTREELAAIAYSYFDAITSHDGTVALTHPGCGRAENRLSPRPVASSCRRTRVQRLLRLAPCLHPLLRPEPREPAPPVGATAWRT